MDIIKEKNEKLEDLISQVEKKFGKGIIAFGKNKREPIPIISSFGSLLVDLSIGTMGIPQGRIGEVYGPESSGKTTLLLHSIAEVQKLGKIAAFVDAEHALDRVWATKLGVDMDKLILSQPDCGEDAFEIIESLIDSNIVDLIVVDSVPALVPKAELEGEMTDQQMGAQARMMGKGIRKITAKISKSKCTVIFINQIRMKIGVMFGSPETQPGGNALKFAASFRIDIRGKDIQKEDEFGQLSKVICCKFVKNKVGAPFKIAEIVLNTNDKDKIYGFDKYSELIDLAVQKDFIKKAGTWYSYNEEKIGQGKDNVIKYLKENENIYKIIYDKVVNTLLEENAGVFGSFDNAMNQLTAEIEEKSKRTRRTKEKENLEEIN